MQINERSKRRKIRLEFALAFVIVIFILLVPFLLERNSTWARLQLELFIELSETHNEEWIRFYSQ